MAVLGMSVKYSVPSCIAAGPSVNWNPVWTCWTGPVGWIVWACAVWEAVVQTSPTIEANNKANREFMGAHSGRGKVGWETPPL
ncbi:hypothetical protein RBWH47_03072 [Rhodopirellula baltica WH47]|uniref:Uncharacterized protein n=1 Tax=Rhodopirellula baltica WH47 TaxID=991778 RepID=F2ASJ5_RHOBT|nr:hypothetical protein RBWH47_03072 [Rhodopirellula baltica WH47]